MIEQWRIVSANSNSERSQEIWELWLKFPNSERNKKDYRPVVRVVYFHRLADSKFGAMKRCTITFNYLQNYPVVEYIRTPSDKMFTSIGVGYFKDKAIVMFKRRLKNILDQLDSSFVNPRKVSEFDENP
jgi:hypothetical protein